MGKTVYQLEGHPAEDLARLCFSKLRFYPSTLKNKLRQEGLWEDLTQELYRIALEGWRQGLTAREIGGMATREIRAFLKAYGYHRYRDGFFKLEILQATISGGEEELWEKALARGEPVPSAHTERDGLEERILALLRKHPEGLSQCQVNRLSLAPVAAVTDHCARLVVRGVIREIARPKGKGRPPSPMLVLAKYDILTLVSGNGGLSKRQLYTRLQIPARLLDQLCAPLIKQGLIVEVNRENTFGRPLTALLVAVQPGQILPTPPMGKTEGIRQAYFLEGKSIKHIVRELHHSKTTVRKAIRGDPC